MLLLKKKSLQKIIIVEYLFVFLPKEVDSDIRRVHVKTFIKEERYFEAYIIKLFA